MTKTKKPSRQAHVASLLASFGHDLEEENVADTPRRFVSYLQEFHQPFSAEEILKDGFTSPDKGSGIHGMLVQDKIPFRAVCMHHLLPFIGEAAVGYIPGDRVIGLSKIARLVQAVGTEKPSIQEAITERIADLLEKYLRPKGLIVVISAEHTCMSARGVAAKDVLTSTSTVRGVLRDVPQARAEFFSIARIR